MIELGTSTAELQAGQALDNGVRQPAGSGHAGVTSDVPV